MSEAPREESASSIVSIERRLLFRFGGTGRGRQGDREDGGQKQRRKRRGGGAGVLAGQNEVDSERGKTARTVKQRRSRGGLRPVP